MNDFISHASDSFALDHWEDLESAPFTGSIETFINPIDKYGLSDFAKDDWSRFVALVNHLSPRDSEIMLLFAVLQKRPTDLSILFGKAGHRAEEDVHKAAHKLAGLIAFGPDPTLEEIRLVLERHKLTHVGKFPFAAFIRRYARCRDFNEMTQMMKTRGWRHAIAKAFKQLHAAQEREAGLLAGWLLWLVDGSDPKGKGWRQRRTKGREYKLGPTTFRVDLGELSPRATGKGGRGQHPATVKITRHMKFVLRGMNG